MRVYLDNAATTRPCEAAILAARQAMEEGFYNPSSLYAPGFSVRKQLDETRGALQSMLKADRLVFTSGGTEANNLAILGGMKTARRRKLLYSAVEHSAVRAACQSLAREYEVAALPVTPEGILDLDAAAALMDGDTALICVMQVNNETGAIQPLEGLIKLRDAACPDALLHVDGVQGFPRLGASLVSGIDSYALSAHKFHSLKGTGALALGKRSRPAARQFGGSQEMELRPGTENTVGILAMRAALEDCPKDDSIRDRKVLLYTLLRDAIPELAVNSPDPLSERSAPHILNLSFPPVRAQTLMHALEGAGVLVSQGSACSSRSKKPNPVLSAMGKSQALMDSALRFSFSRYTTDEEIRFAAEAVKREYQNLRQYTRR